MPQWSAEMLAKFSKPAGSWKCESCLVYNEPSKKQCISCEALKPGTTSEAPIKTKNTTNKSSKRKANVIEKENDPNTNKLPTFTFGLAPGQSAPSTTKTNTTTIGGFTFGIPVPDTNDIDIRREKRIGNIYCFGNGDCGQLGLGEDDLEVETPTVISSLKKKKFHKIACGGMHTLALTEDMKRIYSWGCNDDNVLGRKGEEMIPALIPTFCKEKILQIQGGDCHSAVLTDSGKVFSWGTYRDDNGYVGYNEEKLKQSSPTEVPFRTKSSIIQIASGDNHTLAVTKDGHIFSWGSGIQGQLARRINPRRKKAQLLPNPVSLGRYLRRRVVATQVACGSFHSFAITEFNGVYAWGLNNFGQLGLENGRRDAITPSRVVAFEGKQIICLDGGVHHSVALTKSGQVYTFGRADSGQLGLCGLNENDAYVESPSPVLGIPNICDVSCGGNHTFALSVNGKLYAWGYGEMSQLGTGDEKIETVPVVISPESIKDKTIVAVKGGGQFSMLLAK